MIIFVMFCYLGDQTHGYYSFKEVSLFNKILSFVHMLVWTLKSAQWVLLLLLECEGGTPGH